MDAIVHAADIQDRDGGVLLMATLFGLYPFLLKLYADAGYQGPKFQIGPRLPHRECRDRAAVRHRQVRGFAQALDRGAHHRLVEPLPAPQQRLGMPQSKRHGVPPLGVSSTDAAKALPGQKMILDRL